MFIISKIIGYLLDPFIWILLLLVISMVVIDDKLKRICRRLALVLFIIFSNNYIVNNVWNSYQHKPVDLPKDSKYQYGIVLGGLAGYDEELKRGFFSQASDRFIQAARLYHMGHISKIIVTGGNAIFVKESGYNEADFIGRSLVDLDIPAADILLEKRSRNTLENAAFTKQILDSNGNSGKDLLITSAIHMPRALKVFHKYSIPVDSFPCNYRVLPSDTEFKFMNLIPSAEAFSKWNVLLKEWVGLLR